MHLHLKVFVFTMGILAFLPVQYVSSEYVIVNQNESISCKKIPIDGDRYITLCDIPEAAASSYSGAKQERTDKYLSEATGTVTIMNLPKEDGCCQSAAPVIIIVKPSSASKAMPSILVVISLLLVVHQLC